MHSHDRTLLSKLGFADPDKKEPKHDLACQYLALEGNREQIARMFVGPEVSDTDFRGGWARTKQQPARFEVPITKGRDEYRSTIGFIDLALPHRVPAPSEGCTVDSMPWTWIGVEVKIGRVSASDAIRQLKLYGEYGECAAAWLTRQHRHIGVYDKPDIFRAWLLATAFPLHKDDVATLKAEGIHHIRLGEKFEKWVEARQAETPSGDESPEI